MEPSEIRFTHDSISPVFSCGRRIHDTYRELSTGFKSVHDIPRMTVTLMNGHWYTYTGNRRLWVFQKLEREGHIGDIFVDTTDRTVPLHRFTTRNGGRSVLVRRGGESSTDVPRTNSRIGGYASQGQAPRNVACPICGMVRFKSGAGAVMHVESGSCVGCPGAENARQQIYNFARSHGATQSLLTPMLMDRPVSSLDAGDKPYQCKRCLKTFRHMSSLMQHTKDKHYEDVPRLALGYY